MGGWTRLRPTIGKHFWEADYHHSGRWETLGHLPGVFHSLTPPDTTDFHFVSWRAYSGAFPVGTTVMSTGPGRGWEVVGGSCLHFYHSLPPTVPSIPGMPALPVEALSPPGEGGLQWNSGGGLPFCPDVGGYLPFDQPPFLPVLGPFLLGGPTCLEMGSADLTPFRCTILCLGGMPAKDAWRLHGHFEGETLGLPFSLCFLWSSGNFCSFLDSGMPATSPGPLSSTIPGMGGGRSLGDAIYRYRLLGRSLFRCSTCHSGLILPPGLCLGCSCSTWEVLGTVHRFLCRRFPCVWNTDFLHASLFSLPLTCHLLHHHDGLEFTCSLPGCLGFCRWVPPSGTPPPAVGCTT